MTVIVLFLILLAADIVLMIFMNTIYNDYIWFGAYVIFTLIVALINNSGLGKCKEATKNTLIPLSIIALVFACYSILLPTLYYVYSSNLGTVIYPFLVVYLYPFIDLIFYSLLLGLGTFVEDSVKNFLSVIQFLLLGYGVGITLLVGYTEV